MNVLYIVDRDTQGGATVAFIDMLRQLQKLGVCPLILAGDDNEVIQSFRKESVTTYVGGYYPVLQPINRTYKRPYSYMKRLFFFYWYEIKALKRIDQMIDFSNIDIIHTNSARNDIGCYLNKKYGIPLIMHIREFADADFDCISFRPNYIKIFNDYTTRFLAVSDAVRRHWINKGIENEKVETVYDGVKCDDILLSTDESKKSTKLKMVLVGGVVEAKGQHVAVEAIVNLPDYVKKNIELDIVGWEQEDYKHKILSFANSHGVAKQIHFLGKRTDVHQLLKDYQIGLMCSRSEGFGLVTAEYMHAQLGVIASNTGANPELVEDGKSGMLFKSGDAKSLADKIQLLYNDREMLIRLSQTAHKRAKLLFTQQINANNIYSVYQQILRKEF